MIEAVLFFCLTLASDSPTMRQQCFTDYNLVMEKVNERKKKEIH